MKIKPHTRAVTCGDNVLLCSIHLPNSTSKFTDYHENKITVLYCNRNAEVVDCCFDIEKVNSRKLNVYCYARRAGNATVRLDLGKWYQFDGPTYYCKYIATFTEQFSGPLLSYLAHGVNIKSLQLHLRFHRILLLHTQDQAFDPSGGLGG